MQNAKYFGEKIRGGQLCLGTGISFTDPTTTEALSGVLDFVWIDMEHGALSLESVQGHIMATRGTEIVPLVRVPWNDPVLIKPVLDIGAAGVIVPWIRTADDVRLAVAACRYPPEGIRGFGPRRPSLYGRIGAQEFCRIANETVITIVQIEHIDAVNNLDEILAVPGLTGIVIGPADLSASLGYTGQPRHPEVLKVIAHVFGKVRQTPVFAGIAFGEDPGPLKEWIELGAQWILMGNDYTLMLRSAADIANQLRTHAKSNGKVFTPVLADGVDGAQPAL